MINYHNRSFKVVNNSANGALEGGTIFHYQQAGDVVYCHYAGGEIVQGHLLGLVNKLGAIQMVYHQVNKAGLLMTGQCQSVPEMLANGKLRLHETWQWTSGDQSSGQSVLEEI